MDAETAIETQIEPVLAETFGLRFAKCLATMATLDYITAGGEEALRYRAFVDSVCSSERVQEMWGPELTSKKCQEWKDLVPLEPEPMVAPTATSYRGPLPDALLKSLKVTDSSPVVSTAPSRLLSEGNWPLPTHRRKPLP